MDLSIFDQFPHYWHNTGKQKSVIPGLIMIHPKNVSIILIADSISADIIVPSNSHSSIKQAAKFLASDIEKLTRHGPQISREPKAGKT